MIPPEPDREDNDKEQEEEEQQTSQEDQFDQPNPYEHDVDNEDQIHVAFLHIFPLTPVGNGRLPEGIRYQNYY